MRKDTKGVIALEACVSVLAFMILMLMLSSLFIMFMAQNATSHAILQTAESLSIDVYSVESRTLDESEAPSVGYWTTSLLNKILGKPSNTTNFVSTNRWHETSNNNDVADVVKKRFVGYIAGGDEAEADRILKNLRVINGLNGIDFSKSYISGDDLYAVIEYKLVYDFEFMSDREFPVKQTACARLWKRK